MFTRNNLISMGLALALLSLTGTAQAQSGAVTSHALTLGDKPKYPPGFKQLDYVNANAPKGGSVRMHATGSFDSFNPFIIKGDAASGVGLIFETLMTSTPDDSMSEYGLIAESVTVPEDLSWAEFKIRETARFHDGSKITPDDVIFSFKTLIESGRPHYRFYYANVTEASKTSAATVKFSFKGERNRELPQIMGQLPVLSKKWWSSRDFSATSLEPPLGSGPYRVTKFESGRYVVFERVKDYWGRDLPVNKGRYNFDTIRYDYFKDQDVAIEAFKAGQYDYRMENSSKRWATAYDFPAARAKKVILKQQSHKNPAGMQGFIFNLRRAKFHDPALREALAYAFDFEWSNKNLFYGQYARTRSYFQNSPLAATGLPDAAELKFLEPLRGQVPARVFTKSYSPPASDGSGRIRSNLRRAQRLLTKAGWKIDKTRLINPADGKPLEIEFLLVSPDFERVILPFIRNLKRLGISGRIRTVDPSQYQNRVRAFDFDMIIGTFPQSMSPGNEQRDFWSSEAADRQGSFNLTGIKNPAIDKLVDRIIAAPDRKTLISATRALDRVLQWSHLTIPQWHINSYRIARWDRFGVPAKPPAHGPGFWSWWIDPDKAAALKPKSGGGRK